MKRGLKFSVATILLLFAGMLFSAEYVGSDACYKCHAQQYNNHKTSGHPYKLQKAKDAMKWPHPLPVGYEWDDISYVIGGVNKKTRYINKTGYIITAAKDGSDLKTQYNLETGTWSYYHKGEKKPYDCGRCHTTGYSKEGHQDGLEGLIGTWAAPGIQCEACHGPASDHVKTGNKKKIVIDRSNESCGQCHVRGAKDKIPASKGFIRHHEQLNEILASPHKNVTCITCHNPHKRAAFSIKNTCEDCHSSQARAFSNSTMQQVGLECIDCHMPKAAKSAVAKAQFEGDIRSHIFRISTNPTETMFYQEKVNGKNTTYAKGVLTLGFACLNCHKNKDLKWAAAKAQGIHSYGK